MNDKPDEKPSTSKPSKLDWREITAVLVAGAIGGFASWVYGLSVGEPVAGGFWAIPRTLFMGAFAAWIGVYFIAATDMTKFVHALAFAAACGLAWKPVCDAGSALVQQTVQQAQNNAAEEAGTNLVALADSLATTPPNQVANKLDEVNDAATLALNALPQVSSPKTRLSVETKVNAALRMVSQAAPKDAQKAAEVIQSVGETAAQNQSPKVSATALMSLQTLAPRSPVFREAQTQLTTNIEKTVRGRYMLKPAVKSP